METWLRQRETIRSSLGGVGYVLWPLLLVTFSCAVCGKANKRRASEMDKWVRNGKDGPFCSLSCATIRKNLDAGKSHWSCRICGKRLPSKEKHPSYLCGPECRRVALARSASKIRKVPLRQCETCGITFRPPTIKIPGRFCSRKCQGVGHSKQMRGKGNPGYRHGLSRDQRRWYAAKQKAWERDDSQCVICSTRSPLDVHHINMNPNDNRLENLACLCRVHHKAIHSAERSKPKKILFPWLSEFIRRKTKSYLTSKSRKRAASLQMEFSYTTA